MKADARLRLSRLKPNSELTAFLRPGQSMHEFFVSGGQSTPIALFYALGGHRILIKRICVTISQNESSTYQQKH